MKAATAVRHLVEMASVANDRLSLRDRELAWPLERDRGPRRSPGQPARRQAHERPSFSPPAAQDANRLASPNPCQREPGREPLCALRFAAPAQLELETGQEVHVSWWDLPEPTRAEVVRQLSALVFPNRAGNPIHPSSFNTAHWKPAKAQVGPDGLRFHDLRHTAVALAIAQGAHPKAIQARMGH